MRTRLLATTLVVALAVGVSASLNAAAPNPSADAAWLTSTEAVVSPLNAAAPNPSADEPVNPREELAKLRNTVRRAITGSYVHTGNHGACGILPHAENVDLLIFRNEIGDKVVFRLDATDPLHLTLESGSWDTPHAYLQLAPDGVVVQFKHLDQRRNDSWASVRK